MTLSRHVELSHAETGRWPGETAPALWMVELIQDDAEFYWYFFDAVSTPTSFDPLVGYLETDYGRIVIEHVRDADGTVVDVVLVNLGPDGDRDPGGYDDLEYSVNSGVIIGGRQPVLRGWERWAHVILAVTFAGLGLGRLRRCETAPGPLIVIVTYAAVLACVCISGHVVRWLAERGGPHKFAPWWPEVDLAVYALGAVALSSVVAVGVSRVLRRMILDRAVSG